MKDSSCQARMQLFCLPYAGGNAYFFNSLKKTCTKNVEVVPIEYSGHGTRINEPLIDNIEEFVKDICNEILGKKRNMPYALFGYSLGAKLCLFVAKSLYEITDQKPVHIFAGASQPPNIVEKIDPQVWENDQVIIKILKEYGGLPEEVLKSKEILDLFLPIIKNDFKICEQAVLDSREFTCDCEVTVFYSKDDNIKGRISDWSLYTTGKCELILYEGNHFFINQHFEEIAMKINEKLFV